MEKQIRMLRMPVILTSNSRGFVLVSILLLLVTVTTLVISTAEHVTYVKLSLISQRQKLSADQLLWQQHTRFAAYLTTDELKQILVQLNLQNKILSDESEISFSAHADCALVQAEQVLNTHTPWQLAFQGSEVSKLTEDNRYPVLSYFALLTKAETRAKTKAKAESDLNEYLVFHLACLYDSQNSRWSRTQSVHQVIMES